MLNQQEGTLILTDQNFSNTNQEKQINTAPKNEIKSKPETKKDKNNKKNPRKNIERRLEMIRRNPIYTILVFYDQYDIYSSIKEADKILNVLKKKVGTGQVGAQEVINVCQLYRGIAELIWKNLSKFYPAMISTSLLQWTTLDDSLFEKQMLVNRGNCFPYEAKNEEAAILLVLIKLLRKAKIQYRTSSNYEDLLKLEELKRIEERLKEELDSINQKNKDQFNLQI